jgi:hypothetical protein
MQISMRGLGQDLASDAIAQVNSNSPSGDYTSFLLGTDSSFGSSPLANSAVGVPVSSSGLSSSSTTVYLGLAAVAFVAFMVMAKK